MKVALRNLLKHKGHSFINIFGLSLGMSCCLLLFLWVQEELSYDRYHEKASRIFRVVNQYEVDGQVKRSAASSAPLAPALLADFPEVEKAVRLGTNGFLVSCKDKYFIEQIFFADPEFFEIFNFPIVQGNQKTALKEPDAILISETMKNKYFGEEEPLGKILILDEKKTFQVTGVFKDIPPNSHFRFDFLGNFAGYASKDLTNWGVSNYYTYILVKETSSFAGLKEKLPLFIEKYRGKAAVEKYKTKYLLQPLTTIHLHSNLKNEIEPNSDVGTVYSFSAVALFVLFIACINYINLTTAMYMKREKEIGLRKIFGALRPQLLYEFLLEALFFSLIALVLALILTKLFLPFFNSISGKSLIIDILDNLLLFPVIFGIFLTVGGISGLFPAVFLSSRPPVNTLKGTFNTIGRASFYRRFLVVFQFAISIVFIIATLIIIKQSRYITAKNLGFTKDNMICIPIHTKTVQEKYQTIKSEFLRLANVRAASASTFLPEKNYWYVNYWREGINTDENPMIHCLNVDEDFIRTFEIKILKGRSFSERFPADRESTYILNESAVKEFGWESPPGKKFKLGSGKVGTVIGIIQDFYFRSLYHEIKPAVLYFSPQWFAYFSVRISPYAIPGTLNLLKKKWQEILPGEPFSYSFLDDDIDNLYKTEWRLGKIFTVVAILAIIIACLGLLGLAVFSTGQRTKEIGIHKVHGASVGRIVLLLSREFTGCVLLANIIAWPIAWYTMNKWLKNFAYRTDMSIGLFFMSGAIVLIIALLTIGYKTMAAASANPVNTLRYE